MSGTSKKVTRLPTPVRKLRSFITRLEILHRPIPNGLFSCCFFWPSSDPRVRMHRQANWIMRAPWPLPLWACIQVWLALRWRLIFSTRETNRAVEYYGAAVEASEGLSRIQQQRTVLRLCRRYCIPPSEVYQFQLFRAPDQTLDYVFANETVGMHRTQNGFDISPDHADLQDKLAFAKRAIAVGLPCVPTLAHLPRYAAADVGAIATLAESGVFFKTRSGFHGLGAFSMRMQPNYDKSEKRAFEGLTTDGKPLTSLNETQTALNQLLTMDDVIIQPSLRSHPRLTSAAISGAAAVLSVTTRNRNDCSEILTAHLRIPMTVQTRTNKHTLISVVAKVDVETGRISRNPQSILALRPDMAWLENLAFAKLGDEISVPFWTEIKQSSLAAQVEFNRLWALSWDWIVTPNGPRLLEGNVTWGMKHPQEIAGGLLWAVRGLPVNDHTS